MLGKDNSKGERTVEAHQYDGESESHDSCHHSEILTFCHDCESFADLLQRATSLDCWSCRRGQFNEGEARGQSLHRTYSSFSIPPQ